MSFELRLSPEAECSIEDEIRSTEPPKFQCLNLNALLTIMAVIEKSS